MEPTLRGGDWLLVDPDAFVARRPGPGDLVVAHDPGARERLLIKRVADVGADGLMLAGDHPAHAPEAERIGPVEPVLVIGRPWFRYWPLGRVGAIGGRRPND